MFFVEYDASRQVWNLSPKDGRYTLEFDAAIVTPKSDKFDGEGMVHFDAIYGLIIPPELESEIPPSERKSLGTWFARAARMNRRTLYLNMDGTWGKFSV